MATADATSHAETGSSMNPPGSATKSDAPSKWANPQVPIGNGPDLPKWPLVVSWSAWVLCLGFLIAMLLGK